MIPRVEFWSSTEVSGFQPALVRELRAGGCAAEERFHVPQADYRNARSRGQRLGLRARTYGAYPVQLWRHFTRGDPGRIGVVCSNTFYAPWVALRAERQPRRIIHWVFDLYPDVLLLDGGHRLRGGAGILRALMRETFDRAAANIFLGDHLLRHAEMKFGAIPRAQVIAVGADGMPFRDAEPTALVDTRAGGVLDALYCGNLGRMHEVDTLAAGLRALRGQPWRVRFHGNGVGFETLLGQAHELPQVSFGPNLASADWIPAMKAAQLALVTLRPGAEGLVMPSKTYSAMVSGQAILAVCPRQSDLANLIHRHDAGWTIEPGDVAGLTGLIEHLIRHPEQVLMKRRKAWRAGHQYYAQGVIAKRWRNLIQVVAAQA